MNAAGFTLKTQWNYLHKPENQNANEG